MTKLLAELHEYHVNTFLFVIIILRVTFWGKKSVFLPVTLKKTQTHMLYIDTKKMLF